MAVALPSPTHHCFNRFDTPQGSPLDMDSTTVGSVHLVPNPDFVFPPRSGQESGSADASNAPLSSHKRPVSMHLNLSPPTRGHRAQRQSASALPTFTFNATDTSGMGQPSPELPASPTTPIPVTPSRNMGHRRRASEFVGGDSRFGVSTLVSTSPSKLPETLPLPAEQGVDGSPARRRGHAHRRSAAISGHDLASILQPRDVNVAPPMPTLSLSGKDATRTPSPGAQADQSRPNGNYFSTAPAFETPSQDSSPGATRPPSRPRVGFSENVEYIPRPLSTISSDTASSVSTIRGHSVGNSISSVISLGGTGTPSPRRIRTPPTMDLRATSHIHRASLDSRPMQPYREEAWRSYVKRPASESAAASPNPSITIDEPDTSRLHSKKKSFLKLDRRRSEPLIFAGAFEQPGLSTVSLQDPVMSGPFLAHREGDDNTGNELSRKSSRKRVKAWANAFLGRKARDPRKTKSMVISPDMVPSQDPEVLSRPSDDSLELEPDLDAVFSQDPFESTDDTSRLSFNQPRPDFPLFNNPDQSDEPGSMIDLDAALGPYGTPSMTGGRRQMHSGGFGRRGGAHNRTYSLPALTPFKFDRDTSPVQSSMADVFEEDEEVEPSPAAEVTSDNVPIIEIPVSDDEEGTGIQIVDAVADDEEVNSGRSKEHGLGIHREDVSPMSFPATPVNVRRLSVVEDTIIEEASPIEIVEDYEEPRTSSVTKSSDSSDSTILAERRNLALPSAQALPLTPVSIAASAFSSPDYHSQQGFFDPSRLGTSASSMTDNRTISSFATAEHGPDMRTSAEDVPSLTSSRSTMTSGLHHTFPKDRRDFSDRSGSVVSVPLEAEMIERRRKRSSIQSLSKLVGAPFGESRTRSPARQRPQTAVPESLQRDGKKRKENRLSKLMFWRSKGDSRSASSSK